MHPQTVAELGRSVVVDPGAEPPGPWAGSPRVRVDGAALEQPAAVVAELHHAWSQRRPVVVELGVDPRVLREPERFDVEPYLLDPGHECLRDRLAFLVWANSFDARAAAVARHGAPVWWWARKALAVAPAAELSSQGRADLVLPDGTPAVIDGGPRGGPARLNTRSGTIAVWHREAVEAGEVTLERDGTPRAELADDQMAAVTHRSGPARIIAPAGSGKTRTLTERIRHLVVDRGVSPSTLCAVAYNNRAAAEMRERLRAAGVPRTVEVRTLHSLAWSLLERFSPSRPGLADEREVRRRLSALCDLRPQANSDPLGPYVAALAKVRLELTHPAAVEAARDDISGFTEMFARYVEGLRRDHLVDFDAQIYEAIRLLLRDGSARREAQRRYRHLLVDEFQDLNPAYLLLIRLLAAPELAVFAVGDDDQVIYSHAGATPGFLVDFDQFFPGAAHLALETNYRCPPAVVTAADTLLGYNRIRIPKIIRPGRRDADPSAVAVTTAASGEVAVAAMQRVTELLRDGVAPSDIAVLARVNSALLPVQALARRQGIPVASPVGRHLLNRTGVRAALAYLRCATRGPTGPWPGEAVAEIANRPSRRILAVTRQKMATTPDLDPSRLVSLADRRDRNAVTALAADLGALGRRAAAGAGAAELLRAVRDDIGLGQALGGLDRNAGAGTSHNDDIAALIEAAQSCPDPLRFEPWLQETLGGGSDDGLRLATIHRVKGLEFDWVVVMGANYPLMPHELAEDIEEERRIMHVAVTRARKAVTIVAEAGQPAPFLAELNGTAAAPYVATAEARPSATARRASGRGVRSGADANRRPAATGAAKVPRRRVASGAAGAEQPVTAAVGLPVVFDGDRVGKIVELTDTGAKVDTVDGATVLCRYGQPVTAGVTRGPLVAPDPAEVALRARLLEKLQRWRDQVCARDGVAPRQVGDDLVLSLLAAKRPGTAEELHDVRGFGGVRADRWGDEVVDLISGRT